MPSTFLTFSDKHSNNNKNRPAVTLSDKTNKEAALPESSSINLESTSYNYKKQRTQISGIAA
jgi:hypothetical protein